MDHQSVTLHLPSTESEASGDDKYLMTVQSLGAPADRIADIVRILREEFPSAAALLDALDAFQSPLGFREPCTITTDDCNHDFRGIYDKAMRLKTCALMLKSHHDDPWGE